MFKISVIVFLGSLFALGECSLAGDDLIVDAGILGLIRGTPASTSADLRVRREYMQFRGIPYATITTRFLPSTLKEEKLAPGNNMFNATAPGLSCFQPFLPPVLLTEQCLWLNVYTHKKFSGNETELRPVMFFIHGGAFTIGTGHQFSGLRLMNRDIVYVNFNYRLGLLGFFSLENSDAPGNAAMYDIVNALRWTRNHIRAFGGDPDRITIAGQSAGGVSVTQLMASPMAQGMFRGAIAASGSALNAWGTSTNTLPESLKIANMTACHNLENSPELAAIADCMRAANPVLLVDTLYNYQVAERRAGRLGFSVVSPIVQNFDTGSVEKFLPEHPRKVFQRGEQSDVPLMMGDTKDDGSYVLGVVYNRFIKDNGLVGNSTFLRDQLLPTLLRALGVENVPYGIHDVIAKTYLGDARNSGDFMLMYPGLIKIFNVFFFKGDCYQTAKYHSSVNNTFWYSFNYQGSVSLFKSLYPGLGEIPPFPGGVTHTDDLIYVFALTFLEFTPQEAIVSARMLDYWTDFVITGNPTPSETTGAMWPRLTTHKEEYLVINSESVGAKKYPDSWVEVGHGISYYIYKLFMFLYYK